MEDLQIDIRTALSQVLLARQGNDPPPRTNITTLGSILHRWHHDRRYLDKRAQPIPIRLFGARPSLEALAKSEKLHVPIRDVIADLKSLGFIRKARRGYLPTRRDAIVSHLHPTLVQYAATAIGRMLSTIENNTDLTKKFTYIERSAYVPNLPKEHFPEFCDFAQTQGSALITAVNDWLEARRTSNRPSKRSELVPAGLHLYAFSRRASL